jgi:hypothetical protein
MEVLFDLSTLHSYKTKAKHFISVKLSSEALCGENENRYQLQYFWRMLVVLEAVAL